MQEPEKLARPNLRDVPSVDQLLRTRAARELRGVLGIRKLTHIARYVIAEIRTSVRAGSIESNGLLDEAVRRMEATARDESQAGIKPVINATGVLLHTNLGRAPLSRAAIDALNDAA